MLKHICATLFMLLCALTAFAQLNFEDFRFGFTMGGGPGITGVSSNFNDPGVYVARDYNPVAVQLGATVSYQLKEDITLHSGLIIVSKSTHLRTQTNDNAAYEDFERSFPQRLQYHATFLRVPLTARYYYDVFKDKNTVPFIEGGMGFDMRISDSDPRGLGVDPSLKTEYVKFFDPVILIGTGVRLKTSAGHAILLSVMFNKGIVNHVNESYSISSDELTLRNNMINFAFGYEF